MYIKEALEILDKHYNENQVQPEEALREAGKIVLKYYGNLEQIIIAGIEELNLELFGTISDNELNFVVAKNGVPYMRVRGNIEVLVGDL